MTRDEARMGDVARLWPCRRSSQAWREAAAELLAASIWWTAVLACAAGATALGLALWATMGGFG